MNEETGYRQTNLIKNSLITCISIRMNKKNWGHGIKATHTECPGCAISNMILLKLNIIILGPG